MKKILFVTYLWLVSFFTYAQDCTYQINEIDKFEKVEKVITEKVKVMYPFSKFPVVWFSLGRINNDYLLKMEFSYNKNICFDSHDNELLFITERDSVVRIKRINDKVECTDYKNGIYTGTILYAITKETLLALQNEILSGVRFYYSDGFIESDFLKGNANKEKAKNYFKNNVGCIIKN